jgi:uncharacterized delta-60 repeat protein
VRILCLIVAVALCRVVAHAADGELDPTFGSGGLVELQWPLGAAAANAIALDSGARILVGGTAAGTFGDADFALFRLLPDGALDDTYAPDGGGFRLVDFNLDGIGGNSADAINDLALTADGSVVALGEAHFGFAGVNSQFALSRITPDGTLDPLFGNNGHAHFGMASFVNIDAGRLLHIDAQGRLLVAGMSALRYSGSEDLEWFLGLARLTAQGQFDANFHNGGAYSTVFWADPDVPPPRHSQHNAPLALALDPMARILLGGAVAQPIPLDAAIYRAPADGGFDENFGDDSRVQMGLSEGQASAVLPLPAGGLLVAGARATEAGGYAVFLARRLEDGGPDPGFGTEGLTAIAVGQGHPEPSLIAATRGGGWLVAGRLTDPGGGGWGVVLARFDAQGHPQTGFGNGGAIAVDMPDGRHFSAVRVALQPDGKLVVAGSLPNAGADATAHFSVMRILADFDAVFRDGFENL